MDGRKIIIWFLQPFLNRLEPTKIPLEKDRLESEKGIDYVPLANMLLTGDFKSADQFTRDTLIRLAGDGAVARKYVYFTEVNSIPNKDLATMERLWVKYSNGLFGYSVQKEVWNSQTVRQDFEKFCRKVGWNKMDNGIERKLKWFGNSEFMYDLKAPKGHLPLTNAIRGTTLLKGMINHPVWDTNWRD